MLAPRKKLWSTPDSVIQTAVAWAPLVPSDTVCDVGCGDGRVILRWAELLCTQSNDNQKLESFPSFIGIDIDAERIREANDFLEQAREEGKIDSRISITFHCLNALEAEPLLKQATVMFLYLIPRGLRILEPILSRLGAPQGRLRHVLTYMSPLVDKKPVRKDMILVPHQSGAAWPLYLYNFA